MRICGGHGKSFSLYGCMIMPMSREYLKGESNLTMWNTFISIEDHTKLFNEIADKRSEFFFLFYGKYL